MTDLGTVQVFTVVPRAPDVGEYWRKLVDVATWTGECGLTGVLIFTGNDTPVEPWVSAQYMLQLPQPVSPLVATNPIYVHPYTVAKLVASLTHLFGRRLYLNLVTGTALSHGRAIGDAVEHDARYDRLEEYAGIVAALVAGDAPVTVRGRFFQLEQASLPFPLPPELQPGFVVAGQSDAARSMCERVGAMWMKMLPAQLDAEVDGASGVHLGVVCRPTDEEATQVMEARFPDAPDTRRAQRLSLANTDAEWKRRLFASGSRDEVPTGYSLKPFRNGQADCPFVHGSYDFVASVLRRLLDRGVDAFIVELPPERDEFVHLREALARAVRV